jgi:hypothetical protein
MSLVLNGSGSITGLSAGGLPDGSVTADDIASTLDLSGKTITNMNPSGIYLGGTGAANYLDDYEEGTFTPTNGNITTFNVTSARYTKIGRMVYVSIEFGALNITAGQYFSGLPFAEVEESNGLLVDKTPTFKSHGLVTTTEVYFIDSYTDGNGIFSATYITS